MSKIYLGNRIFRNRTITLLRTIMTSPYLRNQIEEAAEQLKSNPYYEKYAHKIATLQNALPEEFLSRVEARQEEKSKSKHNVDNMASSSRQYSSLLKPKKVQSYGGDHQIQSLDKIMRTDLLKDKEPKEITQIWGTYHRDKDVIAATIPIEQFEEMMEKAQMYPFFLFPIPRSQGYEFIVCQFYQNVVHFTPLLNYQVHKENAPECLTIAHFTEFKDSKGIVLMRGEFDKNVLNVQEAQCLANQLQLYYSQKHPEKIALLETFTKKPHEFKHMNLIKQIETLSLQ